MFSQIIIIFLSQVQVGMCVLTVSGEEVVRAVSEVEGRGVHTIVTNEVRYCTVNTVKI